MFFMLQMSFLLPACPGYTLQQACEYACSYTCNTCSLACLYLQPVRGIYFSGKTIAHNHRKLNFWIMGHTQGALWSSFATSRCQLHRIAPAVVHISKNHRTDWHTVLHSATRVNEVTQTYSKQLVLQHRTDPGRFIKRTSKCLHRIQRLEGECI